MRSRIALMIFAHHDAPCCRLQDIDWHGSNNQVRAAMDAGVDHILLVSSMGSTEPNSFLDLLGNGHIVFFKLNGEIDLMGSGAPYTVVKPGGLLNDEGRNTPKTSPRCG